MKFLSIILGAIVLLALFAVNPAHAGDNWDIGEFDSCMALTTEEQDRIFGDDIDALTEHNRYCCDKSGGVWRKVGTGGYCVAPPANASSAASVGILKDWINSGRLERVCRDVNGLFDKGPTGENYLCRKENCDLKGGECQVFCAKDRQCVFITPDRLTVPVTLFGILQFGDNVSRSKGEASPSSGGEKAKPDEPDEPDEPPCGPDGCLY